nr:2Fe-2S iron-sulfur cluster-binding protein [uncultured Brevundimonas sp.]
MNHVIVIGRNGEASRISAELGLSLMEVIRDSGSDELLAICGGACACATCHVYVDERWYEAVGAPGEDEDELLEASGVRKTTSRLSCQIGFNPDLDGMQVEVAPEGE